jgi:hypothetical protein
MKIFTFLAFLTLCYSAYAQTNKVAVVKDTNYYYRDTVDKKAYIGSYEPTGLVQTPNNSLIISNKLEIDFPEMYDTSKPNMEYKKFLEYEAHLHISSGSIFKLNNQYKKDWEIILKNKRVIRISPYDSTSFIAAGENINMRKIWAARINIIDGKILWMKEFAVRHQSTISELGIANNKDIIILNTNKRIIPISIRKQYYKTRLLLFKKATDFEHILSLSSLSGNGELNWTKTVDFKNRYDFESYGMKADSTISILSRYSGFDKVHGKYIQHEAEVSYSYNLNGHETMRKLLADNDEALSIYANGWTFVNLKSDSISIEKLDQKANKISYNVLKTPEKYLRIETLRLINDAYYLYGYTNVKDTSYLICKFDSKFHLINSWAYKGLEWNNDAQLAFDDLGQLIILGRGYKKPEKESIYEYVKLIKLRLQ